MENISLELIYKIILYLDIEDILRLTQVNKFYYKIINSKYIWQKLLYRDFRKTNLYNKTYKNNYIKLNNDLLNYVKKNINCNYISLSQVQSISLINNNNLNVFYRCINLTHLSIYNNNFHPLIEELPKLTSINLNYTTNHNSLLNLTTLKKLTLNNINNIPTNLDLLSKLTDLNISSCSNIPDTIYNLINLEHLTINLCQSYQLKENLAQLSNLQYLCLSNNNWLTIPNSLNKLTKLKFLTLEGNKLTNIKCSKLTNLQSLNLSHFNGEFPFQINNLINLEEFYFYHSKFTTLNLNLPKLTKLKGSGKIKQYNLILPLLKYISVYNIYINLDDFPYLEEVLNTNIIISKIHTIKILSIGNVDLLDTNLIPTCQELYISNSKQIIFPTTSNFNLKKLSITTEKANYENLYNYKNLNKFTININEFNYYVNCKNFFINYNNLLNFPKYYSHIKILNLSNNKIRKFPEEILDEILVENLYLSYNLIEVIPPNIKHYKQLKFLDIGNNKISQLIPEISFLQNLTTIICNNNKINYISKDLVWCKNLSLINISGNPIKYIPTNLSKIRFV